MVLELLVVRNYECPMKLFFEHIELGMGLSFVYVPAVVIVAHYFDENRAIATAIAVGGTGLNHKNQL